MSEKKDFRLTITVETDVALRSVARAFGRDLQSVARDVLHEWALKKLHEYRVGSGLAESEGVLPASGGRSAVSAGFEAEEAGMRRHGGRR